MIDKQPLSFDTHSTPKVLLLYLELNQYPILSKQILNRMLEEVYKRGVITQKRFEYELKKRAMESQLREGIVDPMWEETLEVWEERLDRVREILIIFYFGHNLSHDIFKQIVAETVNPQGGDEQSDVILSFNPELAPWDLLFQQGEHFDSRVEDEPELAPHLKEIIVVLIRGMISDQIAFLNIASEYFTIADLTEIKRRRIGRGKIGGKAAGMLLAHKVLQEKLDIEGMDTDSIITIPESYYIGADVYDDFKNQNDLMDFMNQKYKSTEEIKSQYPNIAEAFRQSVLPSDVVIRLRMLLEEIGNAPLIVRSSSLLEDNFDTSFAGKYDSFFLPNQGTAVENLTAMLDGIKRIYASILSPDALIYRRRMKLHNFDERMSILIQKVEGERYKDYFFPAFAGVGFGHNPHQWSKRIKSEAGLLRLVAGMGTRAVDRVGEDYPRMVALSHPKLRPERSASMLRHYSQTLMDVIDLKSNSFKSIPFTEILDAKFKGINAIVSIDKGEYVEPLLGKQAKLDPEKLIITFDRMLEKGSFVKLTRAIMQTLNKAYEHPVDMEFAGYISKTYPEIEIQFVLLQCRPQSRHSEQKPDLPKTGHVQKDNILFTANQQVPYGKVENIEYIVYVDPITYATIPENAMRHELSNVIGKLNETLPERRFILMGPGRWGSSNIQLGVPVTYTEIYKTSMLIEIAYADGDNVPDVSYGTHFFQDLVEAKIHPLPLYPDDEETTFNKGFFTEADNMLETFFPEEKDCAPYLKVIDVRAATNGQTLSVVMNSEINKGIAYFVEDDKSIYTNDTSSISDHVTDS